MIGTLVWLTTSPICPIIHIHIWLNFWTLIGINVQYEKLTILKKKTDVCTWIRVRMNMLFILWKAYLTLVWLRTSPIFPIIHIQIWLNFWILIGIIVRYEKNRQFSEKKKRCLYLKIGQNEYVIYFIKSVPYKISFLIEETTCLK